VTRTIKSLEEHQSFTLLDRQHPPATVPANLSACFQLFKRKINMSAKLFVGNLSFETTSDEIRDLFSEVGPVESCQVITDRDTGRSKGFGFVEMNSKAEANSAKEKFDGQELHGRALKVDEAKPKVDSRSNGGGAYGARY
jgi:RNA recognition motif-containing protein